MTRVLDDGKNKRREIYARRRYELNCKLIEIKVTTLQSLSFGYSAVLSTQEAKGYHNSHKEVGDGTLRLRPFDR